MFGILMPGIDNYAHAGGFAGGYLAGMLARSAEARARGSHVIAAACLALSGIAIAFSLIPHSGRR